MGKTYKGNYTNKTGKKKIGGMKENIVRGGDIEKGRELAKNINKKRKKEYK